MLFLDSLMLVFCIGALAAARKMHIQLNEAKRQQRLTEQALETLLTACWRNNINPVMLLDSVPAPSRKIRPS